MSSSPTSQASDAAPDWYTEDPDVGPPLFGPNYSETEYAVQERWLMCHKIARHAWTLGLDTDPMGVNRHYRIYKLWYAGGLATGYLMKHTGVKYAGGRKQKEES
jgi:hypothetical protein